MATLKRANLEAANLIGANIRGAKLPLEYQNMIRDRKKKLIKSTTRKPVKKVVKKCKCK